MSAPPDARDFPGVEIKLKPDDPGLGDDIAGLINRATVHTASHADITAAELNDVSRNLVPAVASAMFQFQSYALTLLTHAATAGGLMPGTVKLTEREGGDGRTRTFDVTGEIRDADVNPVVLGTVTTAAVNPSATGGLTIGFQLHLTPAGCRPLWDFGDVVAAEATENYPHATDKNVN